MTRKNIFVRAVCSSARKFRAIQEVWILPWWGSGGLAAAPLWALDTVVLCAKLVSTCAMAVFRVLIPPIMKSLHGETVLITGAGHGVGRELAVQLAEMGATVLCWDCDERRNNAVVDDIVGRDGDVCVPDCTCRVLVCECFGYTVDVTSRQQVTSTAALMRRQCREVSMVISNAGSLTCAPLSLLRPDAVAKLVEVNLTSHLWVIQAFLPSMIEKRRGHLVAVNSSAGLLPCADMVPYCAAKHGLKGLMDSLSEELRLDSWTKNIHVTTAYLGTVSTGLYPAPAHRFTSCYAEISAQDAAKAIIEGIRKNKKTICIPSFMNTLIQLHNLLPYRIRIIFIDFFNFKHRGWFCFC